MTSLTGAITNLPLHITEAKLIQLNIWIFSDVDFPPLVTGTEEELGDGPDDEMTRDVLREAVFCLLVEVVGGVVVVVVSGLQSPVVDPLLARVVLFLFDSSKAVSPGCILHSKIITSIEV